MKDIDKRDYLKGEPFDYRETKNAQVFVLWEGKQVKILKGKDAQKFLNKVTNLDTHAAQLTMAKVTGNFKRGNERG